MPDQNPRKADNPRLSIARRFGAGDEAGTRNFQLGNLDQALIVFNAYKIAQKNRTYMQCIPRMHSDLRIVGGRLGAGYYPPLSIGFRFTLLGRV